MATFKLFVIEIKKHLHLFVACTLVNVLFNIFFSIRTEDQIYGLINILTAFGMGLFLFFYIFRDLYYDLYIGKNKLNHLIPIRMSTYYIVKLIVFHSGMFIVWCGSLIQFFFSEQGLYTSRIITSSYPVIGIFYYILGKWMGIWCALAMIGFALSLAKLTHYSKAGAYIAGIIVMISSILVFQFVYVYSVPVSTWSIQSDSVQSFTQYAGLLTIQYDLSVPIEDISSTIHWASVIINGIATLLFVGVAIAIFNSKRYEIYEEEI